MAKKVEETAIKQFNPENSFKELYDRISCNTGLIFLDTPEEPRIIRSIFKKFGSPEREIQYWSFSQGLIVIPKDQEPEKFYPHDIPPESSRTLDNNKTIGNLAVALKCIEVDCRKKIKDNKEYKTPMSKNIYILRDASVFFQAPGIIRTLRDIIYLTSIACSNIVITGYGMTIPNDIIKDSHYIKLKFPTTEEIQHGLFPKIKSILTYKKSKNPNIKIDDEFPELETARACTGLTEDQILNTISYSLSTYGKIDIDKVNEEKRSIINKSDILDFWVCQDSLSSIGGFDELKKWFNVRKVVMSSPNAESFGAETPKGIMLLGVQGSGKTLTAKALAQSWSVGLIKLEMGKVFAGYVGESEKRMRMALQQIDAVAPVVVVIDEIDKGLSGAGSSDKTDGGTTSRVIGTLLTWLQESHPGVFLIATANDITNLRKNHPELLRKGRFDEIWFSDSPTLEERKEIFAIHLKKKGRDPKNFDLDVLAKTYYDDNGTHYEPSGAEIEYGIKDAIQEAFALGGGKKLIVGEEGDITTELIVEKLKIIKPITYICKDTITGMRKWSKINARNVSSSNINDSIKSTATNSMDLRFDLNL